MIDALAAEYPFIVGAREAPNVRLSRITHASAAAKKLSLLARNTSGIPEIPVPLTPGKIQTGQSLICVISLASAASSAEDAGVGIPRLLANRRTAHHAAKILPAWHRGSTVDNRFQAVE